MFWPKDLSLDNLFFLLFDFIDREFCFLFFF